MKKKYVNTKQPPKPRLSAELQCLEPTKRLDGESHRCTIYSEHYTHYCCCGVEWETYE